MNKYIPGFPDYFISENGQVYSKGRLIDGPKGKRWISGTQLKPQVAKRGGYLIVKLQSDKRPVCVSVHRMVAITFLSNPLGLKEVNHLDGNKLNNNVSNLEWCTHADNMKHAKENKLFKPNKTSNTKAVIAYNHNAIFHYSSVREAGRSLGIHSQNICAVLKGKQRTTGGYNWTYEAQKNRGIGLSASEKVIDN